MTRERKRHLALFLLISLAGHLAALGVVPQVGSYVFTRPVCAASVVEVHLERLAASPPAAAPQKSARQKKTREGGGSGKGKPAVQEAPPPADRPMSAPAVEKPAPAAHAEAPPADGMKRESEAPKTAAESGSGPSRTSAAPPGKAPSAYLSATREKLSYQIFLLGIPVGGAVLEAKQKAGEMTINWSVRSNPFAEGFYHVEDQAQSRLMGGGNYIVSRVVQQEGSFRSDSGFTLCFPEKKAFWADRLRNLVSTQPIEEEDTTDIFFGFYYLRNQPLEVGKTVMLHLFDSSRTVQAPVEVLRKERIRLALFKEVDTVVVRPAFNTDAFFKGTGDLTIWLTDDQYRVPVRLETKMALGAVRAELVAAEAEGAEGTPLKRQFDADGNLRKSD